LDTDILFAGNCGLQSLLVLSGFSTLDEVHRKQTSGAVEDQKQIPMYYLPSLGDLVPMLGV
jgi:phosphoglycolate phosphatase